MIEASKVKTNRIKVFASKSQRCGANAKLRMVLLIGTSSVHLLVLASLKTRQLLLGIVELCLRQNTHL